jgi:hypothetical protein
MKRLFVIAVLAEFVIAAIVLHSQIKDFLWTHPWWHSFLVLVPAIAVPVISVLELMDSRETNRLRLENIRVGDEANRLRNEQKELQGKHNQLQGERNELLDKIASNTQRPLTESEINARTLKKYKGQRAFVTEAGNHWGAMGAVIAEINDNNVLTLFNPANSTTPQAWGQAVRCDKLHVVEEAVGSCPVQINVIERYGQATNYGEARTWEERNTRTTVNAPRGNNVFNATYRKDGSKLRRIDIYESTNGSPNYSLVTCDDMKETATWYSSKLDTEKIFSVLQVEWSDQGYRYTGGGGSGILNLFIRK